MTPNRITMRVLEDSLPKDKERYLDGQRFWGQFLGYLFFCGIKKRSRPRLPGA